MYVTNDDARPKVISVIFFFVVFSLLECFVSCSNETHLKYYCNFTSYQTNSTYQFNLENLFGSLFNYALSKSDNAYRSAVAGKNPNSVYGRYYCRGDVTNIECGNCVSAAERDLVTKCPNSKSGQIIYEDCIFQYSNESFFSLVSEKPVFHEFSPHVLSEFTEFNRVLNDTLAHVAIKASSDSQRYATQESDFILGKEHKHIFSLAQCSPDLSEEDCKICLVDSISSLFKYHRNNDGARVVFPSCNVRFEAYRFYKPRVLSPLSASIPGKQKIASKEIGAVVVPIIAGAILLFIIFYFMLTRLKKGCPPKEQGANDILISTDSVQFDFITVREATNNFAEANRIGQGGFGSVYKGTLPNGQQIAIKRLSRYSRQGEDEFLNEVMLVAKLQHRNLVKLRGFCLEGGERILIYEFVPNKSLDYFLFDSERCKQLDWKTRHKIIQGIARGLLYLHEDSRLRIIHRDLKASNILLNEDMNPKISDFGLARMFDENQTQANTNRIVGTYGYMSPEYAMHGQFSVKSDTYSFGVLLLEIVIGKKNSSFFQEDGVEDLSSYVWRCWKEGTAFGLIDPFFGEDCCRNEVLRCIHIGLLCVQEVAERPTMADVVLMLDSNSVSLPTPSQPALFVRHTMDSGMLMPWLPPAESDQCGLITITDLAPR